MALRKRKKRKNIETASMKLDSRFWTVTARPLGEQLGHESFGKSLIQFAKERGPFDKV